jgi:hypothetical protein
MVYVIVALKTLADQQDFREKAWPANILTDTRFFSDITHMNRDDILPLGMDEAFDSSGGSTEDGRERRLAEFPRNFATELS